jgi:hypothetical protein
MQATPDVTVGAEAVQQQQNRLTIATLLNAQPPTHRTITSSVTNASAAV